MARAMDLALFRLVEERIRERRSDAALILEQMLRDRTGSCLDDFDVKILFEKDHARLQLFVSIRIFRNYSLSAPDRFRPNEKMTSINTVFSPYFPDDDVISRIALLYG